MDYSWIKAFAEMTGRKCSEDEQLLILSQFSQSFKNNGHSPHEYMERCRRQIGLSPRLNEVLNCLLENLSNKAISQTLQLSEYTVKGYVKQVLAHYMVSSRRELLAAVKNGRLLQTKNKLASDSQEEQLFAIMCDLMSMDISVTERRRYFFDHFMKILGATRYIWYESEFDPTMVEGPKAFNVLTNLSPELQQLFFEAANDPNLTDPYMVPSVTHHITNNASSYIRQEFLKDEDWYDSPYTRKYYQVANMDHPMSYTVSQGGNQHCGIMIFRSWQADPFTLEERDFMNNIFSSLPWLFLQKKNINKSYFAELTPHQHKILLLLIDGYGKKELAEHLNISENTANDHIKKIYKMFQVKSYGELMKFFMH